jgi:hypothetical protein
MNKPIPWPKLAAAAFSATMMVGYIVFRTAYAQEGGAESRVLPSSKSGRVVPRQQRAQSPYGQPQTYVGPTTTTSTTMPVDLRLELQQRQSSEAFQLAPAGTTQSHPVMLPSSKSAAVMRPSDVDAIFINNNLPGTPPLPPTSQPASPSPAPTTHFSLEPQRRQHR